MAKAIIGHLGTHQRGGSHQLAENRRLRTRVAELEALVLRLQAENDRLAAAVREESRAGVDLQPA